MPWRKRVGLHLQSLLTRHPIDLIRVFLVFVFIALTARALGGLNGLVRLPLMSIFIFTGITAGPYFLAILDQNAAAHLILVDWFALPFIAFAAGAELRVVDLNRRLRTIASVVAALGLTVHLASIAVFLLFST
ncbi:MAG TPA: hypothetical protein PLP17_12145, partial [Oligoflexia bacterium]|nr:hypothetical protein [Oligoflexia bacterium]